MICQCACHRTNTKHYDGERCCDPYDCPGVDCHDGDFPEFDHFCDSLNVTAAETPHAFAAWLGHLGWEGSDYGPACEVRT